MLILSVICLRLCSNCPSYVCADDGPFSQLLLIKLELLQSCIRIAIVECNRIEHKEVILILGLLEGSHGI